MMEELHETKISDARWIAYDIPGNVGWIMYIVVLVLFFAKQSAFMEVPLVLLCVVVGVLPAISMLVGIAELLNERCHKLDRVLTKKRLGEKEHEREYEALLYEHGTHFAFPQSMLDIMMPLIGSLFVGVAFKAGRQFPKECKRTRMEIDRELTEAMINW